MPENMQERIRKTRERYSKNKGEIPQDMKICPFMSSATEKVPCNSECALYRSSKQRGYECPITELTSMSWVLKGSPMKGKR